MRQEDGQWLKVVVYRTVLVFRSETWAVTKADQDLLETTEMGMLRWMMED